MIQEMIVKPWFEMNRPTDENIHNGALAVTWDMAELQMEFGRQSKKDLLPEELAQWVQVLATHGVISKRELRKIAETAGVPELMTELDGNIDLVELVEPIEINGDDVKKPSATKPTSSKL